MPVDVGDAVPSQRHAHARAVENCRKGVDHGRRRRIVRRVRVWVHRNDVHLRRDPSQEDRQALRVSGRVAPGSLEVSTRDSQANFALAAPAGLLRVVCQGPLPDNLAEDIDVVVEGQLDEDGTLRGTKLLTRCASKYESMPNGQAEAGAKEAP